MVVLTHGGAYVENSICRLGDCRGDIGIGGRAGDGGARRAAERHAMVSVAWVLARRLGHAG